MLPKRHYLRPELSGTHVRVRVTDDNLLTYLYWHNVINDIQYSTGCSYLSDIWKAGIAGKPAQNLEASHGSGYQNYIPYGVMPMLRLRQAHSHLNRVIGTGVAGVLKALQEPPKKLSTDDIIMVINTLNELSSFYQGYSPVSAIKEIANRAKIEN